ncbi:hypothetical protein FACS189485_09630 [Spirochaetia bacterium]|nr:hypothetical protein FACS189485_09630 [Spirochaetia bacterium]
MTQKEFYTCVGYLANPVRKTLIEAELKDKDMVRLAGLYSSWTGGLSLPNTTSSGPIFILKPNADKWGIEWRMYLLSNTNLPPALLSIREAASMRRPGYASYNYRTSHGDEINQLLQTGFLLGGSQNITRIQSYVPATFLTDFNTGFSL